MRSRVAVKSYGLDLDADPVFVPAGFEVVEHIRGGFLNWTPHRPQIELYLSDAQRKGIVSGVKVFEAVQRHGGTIVNANALDFLIDHVTDFSVDHSGRVEECGASPDQTYSFLGHAVPL